MGYKIQFNGYDDHQFLLDMIQIGLASVLWSNQFALD